MSDELYYLLDNIKTESQKYDRIVKDWHKKRPKYERRIGQYQSRIKLLNGQIQDILMERISDKAHTDMYNDMIAKREAEVRELEAKIEENRKFDEYSKTKSSELKSTAEILEDILTEPKLTDADLRMLVDKVLVHQNEDKSLEVKLVFNVAFSPSRTVEINSEK
ncbi:MAG: hypothetical protein K6F71_04760 [Ruminococcus sp.]|uniref:hypothetical protein n=1 Tax=Ruminococcus sp. TaxID=41978 RepID=UPI0025D69202|nr:hypothetical protein [Ruminococcus sp.]MCR5540124.1 hypothetical protein [Ruminococcus sp.]